MYESPISEMINDIYLKIQDHHDAQVMKAVQNVGINVNRDELISALSYDRKQYDKGYADGIETKRILITRINEWLDPDIDTELALERIRAIIYEETHCDG